MSGTIIDLSCDDAGHSSIDASSLANVATTGDYNDLINKPDLSDAAKITCEFTAQESISAYRVIYTDGAGGAFLADKDLSPDSEPVGVSITAATTGNIVDVQMFGKITDPYFGTIFSPGDDLFLGDDGLITNTPATSGYHIRVGKYVGNNTIFLDIDERICL